MIIYNIFPRLAGTFPEWSTHFTRAAEMGFDWIFVNPIQKTGNSNSLYSIADYFSFNPQFVNQTIDKKPEDQVREMIDTAAKCGLKVMIDLVINHCAYDSPLLRQNPQWFEKEPDGSFAHPYCVENNGNKVVWGDLIKYDYRHTSDAEGLFRHCLKVVEYLVLLGFRGFRCDAAYQIPFHFWQRLIRETRAKYPDVIFTAETLGCTADQTRDTAMAGFDYVFNSCKWWDFRENWLLEQYNLVRDICPSIAFPESHDTKRLADELNGNINAVKQRYLFSATFSAGVMIPIGFEFGFRKPLHVVNTRPADWERHTGIDLQPFITKVNEIKKNYRIFQEDSPTNFLSCNNPNVLLMWKASISNREEALLIMNKDIYNQQTFYANDLREYIQSGAPMADISPEYRLDHLPKPFHYDLRPGQGILLMTKR